MLFISIYNGLDMGHMALSSRSSWSSGESRQGDARMGAGQAWRMISKEIQVMSDYGGPEIR